MKISFEGARYKLLGAFFATFGTLTALAQEEGGATTTVKRTSTTHTSTVGGDWYAEPWVLIVGIALFVLLLVAIIAGNRSRSTTGRTDVQKTTITKTDYRGTDA